MTNRLSSAAPAQTAFLDSSQIPTAAGAEGEITAEIADRIAKMNDPANVPVPTSVGIPALTPEMIAEHAKLMAEADRASKGESHPGPAPPKPAAIPQKKGGMKGSLIAVVLFVVLAAVAWFVYQQQAQAAAEHESLVREAASLNLRAKSARERLGRVAPGIEGMPAGSDHDQALKLRESILKNLDDMAPLVEPSLAKPDSLSRAKSLCDRVESDVGQVENLVRSAAATQTATPSTPS